MLLVDCQVLFVCEKAVVGHQARHNTKYDITFGRRQHELKDDKREGDMQTNQS